MSTGRVSVDRQTPMLLPPDLRDWVLEDDLVHFILEALGGMKRSGLKVNERGTGSEHYPPRMMLGLLLYCYANGIFSSRRIERATYRDVGVHRWAATRCAGSPLKPKIGFSFAACRTSNPTDC